MITSDGDHRRVRHRASPARPPQLPTPTPPRPVLQGPLDSWLSARSVQAEVDKAAKLLALAETPTKIASQVQDHVRELAEKTIELETKLAIAECETMKLKAKLK